MGWGAARKLRAAVANLTRILAIEVATAGRAIDLRAPLQPAAGTAAALAHLRSHVAGPGADRFLSPELRAAEELVRDGSLVAAVQDAIGPLS
jgi:histidine ammonia-lyase